MLRSVVISPLRKSADRFKLECLDEQSSTMFDSIHDKAAEVRGEIAGLSLKKIQDEIGTASGWLKQEVKELPSQAIDCVTDEVRNHWKRDGLIALAALAAYGGVRLTYLQKGIPWLGLLTEVPAALRGGLGDYRRIGLAMERDVEMGSVWRRAALSRLSEKGIAAPQFKLRWQSIPEE
jgi:hypothetical protein